MTFSLVRHNYASRITAGDSVVSCVVHLVEPIEHDIGFDGSTSTGSGDREVHPEKPGHGDASGRPRHIHVIQPCPGSKTSQCDCGTRPPRGKGGWIARSVIRGSL